METKTIAKYLKNNLSSCMIGYEKERLIIKDLFLRVLQENESNSALLVGPQRVGKTKLLKSVVIDLQQELSNAMLITLNGLILTDDKQAMKSIVKQMRMETQVEGKEFKSLTENMYFLLSCLKEQKGQQHRLIFIIDNFDLFCSHHNQTLLYSLFDVVQSALVPVCVLGVSSRDDVIELLEKRVKSRFSHRQIFLHSNTDDFDDYMENFKQLLRIPSSVVSSAATTQWNKKVESVAKSDKCLKSLKHYFHVDASYSSLKMLVFHLISSNLNDDHFQISADDVVKHVEELIMVKDKVHLVTDLSVLELCLLIAIKHHSDIYDNDPFNFEIIFSRLNKFFVKSSSMQNITRQTVLKSFENLKLQEVIVAVGVEGKVQKEYQMCCLKLFADHINTAVKTYQNLPTEVIQWSKSSLM